MAQPEQIWLDQARASVLRGDLAGAGSLATAALLEYPRSFELRRVLAGVCQQTNQERHAESLLRELLGERPGDFAAALALARLLISQARNHSAAQVLRKCFEHGEPDPELAIKAVELLDGAARKGDAAAIADIALAAAPDDARLHAYAGMLQIQLGDFKRARNHYQFALRHSPHGCEWNAPLGLANAQRYGDSSHPDFALFRECMERTDLSEKARSTLLFAMGKAHDDIGDYEQAATYFRQANAIAHSLTRWSRKDWRRVVEARLASRPRPQHAISADDFVPIFIVGMPRSGTTLLAELLARYPQVCNRGELPWIGKLAQRPELVDAPEPGALERAAEVYRAQAKQDDPGEARWFVDKQPLNFRYLDLILELFPDARIIHCDRNSRDIALSIWMQSFYEDVQGYAYDFRDITLVMGDCRRLMAHWRERFPEAIRTVRYEELVAQPRPTMDGLADWIGLSSPLSTGMPPGEKPVEAISTASLWQARQPIHTGSVNRWENYVSYVKGLLSVPVS